MDKLRHIVRLQLFAMVYATPFLQKYECRVIYANNFLFLPVFLLSKLFSSFLPTSHIPFKYILLFFKFFFGFDSHEHAKILRLHISVTVNWSPNVWESNTHPPSTPVSTCIWALVVRGSEATLAPYLITIRTFWRDCWAWYASTNSQLMQTH